VEVTPREVNVHVQLVRSVLQRTNAYVLLDHIDKFLSVLPRGQQAIYATLAIQVVPIFLIFGLSKILFASKRLSNFLLPVFIAFAMGGLLGDVFFHTLPHLQP